MEGLLLPYWHTNDRQGKERMEEKKKSKLVIGIIIAAVVVLVIAGAYVGCCFATGTNTVLGHTYVGSEDLIGMTGDAVSEKVSEIYANTYSDAKLNVTMNESSYEMPVFDAMLSPVDEVTAEAMDYGHGFFLTRGACFISSLISGRTLALLPSKVDDAKLDAVINASNIIEENCGSSSGWEISGDKLNIIKRTASIGIKNDELKAMMKDAITRGDFDTEIACPYIEIPLDSVNLQAIYDQVHTEPQNATLEPENNYAVIESVDGISFDLDKAKKLLTDAKEGETVTIPLVHTPAEISSKELEETLFRDVMGTYTTTVRGSADRRSNVKLAASKCEKIMFPGDVFSYNETVGKRTEAAGFQKAPAYSNGDTVQELGGGICQASSTLYNAVVIANLEITERHNHSFASSYVPLGQDATVSWGGPDFKFTNNTDYPIKIEQIYEDDKLTFNIIGTNVTGEYCSLTNQTLSTNPYAVVEQPSADLYIGQSKRAVEGETGYKVKTYRHLYSADGTEISVTEEDTSNYIRRDEVRLVGTKLPDDVMAALMQQVMGQ